MYSGLLPSGLTEDDLSPDDEEESDAEKTREGEKCDISGEKLSPVGKNTGSVVEAHSSYTVSDADSDSPRCSMPGISQEMWQVRWICMQWPPKCLILRVSENISSL